MTTRERQQRNTTVTQFDSSDLFGRRPEEYEGTLIVLTAQLLCILNELRCHFQGIAEESERDMDWFEESATQPIVMISRNGEVGRPRFLVKFPTVIGQVLTVPCYHYNSLGSRLLKPVHIPLGFFCSSLEVTL